MDDDEPPPFEEITVNLTHKNLAGLVELSVMFDMTQTDGVNKAIGAYLWLRQIIARGGVVYVREPDNPELMKVSLL